MKEMIPVNSSLITGVRYEAETRELFVRFRAGRGGGLYVYRDVSPEAYREMMGQKSVGGYFIQRIKPFCEDWEKL